MNRQIALALVGIAGIGGQLALVPITEASLVFVVVATVLLVAMLVAFEAFARTFDYPLFFVRNELNYWGGAFGGVAGGSGVLVGSAAGRLLGLSVGNEVLIIASLVWLGGLSLTLWTGAVLRDVENGYGS